MVYIERPTAQLYAGKSICLEGVEFVEAASGALFGRYAVLGIGTFETGVRVAIVQSSYCSDVQLDILCQTEVYDKRNGNIASHKLTFSIALRAAREERNAVVKSEHIALVTQTRGKRHHIVGTESKAEHYIPFV